MTYEQKLLTDLNKLPGNTWFQIAGRSDNEKIVTAVKSFITGGHDFVFSSDYTKIKRYSAEWQQPIYHTMKQLPQGITIDHVAKGTPTSIVGFKGQVVHVEQPEHWVVKCDGRIIAVE